MDNHGSHTVHSITVTTGIKTNHAQRVFLASPDLTDNCCVVVKLVQASYSSMLQVRTIYIGWGTASARKASMSSSRAAARGDSGQGQIIAIINIMAIMESCNNGHNP